MANEDRVRHRRLGCRTAAELGDPPGISRLLDCVTGQDGVTRAFFGMGTSPSAFRAAGLAEGPDDAAQPVELRPVSGATLGVFAGTRVALAGGGHLSLAPSAAETDYLAGRNVLLAFRLEESPLQVAEWLIYHMLHHGTEGAVIVNRIPGDFAKGLAALIDDTALRVVVLDCPLPIGKPGIPPENHLYLAPDAPGKDRMIRPEADPWRSPVGEPLIHEVCKWRFLAHVRAVLTLDVTDILQPRAAGQPPVFDLCLQSKTGVILLLGRHIYPWRIRVGQGGAGQGGAGQGGLGQGGLGQGGLGQGKPGQRRARQFGAQITEAQITGAQITEARLGDHICRPFDRGDQIARWGAAPARAGLRNTWRGVRVSFAPPDAAVSARFDRAMAIRVPGASPAELVPRASLVEDKDLVALSQGLLGWNPVRAPLTMPRSGALKATGSGRTAIVTTMRNEGPFILEWIAWHRAIGVDDFLVYTNDCTDGTNTFLALLQRKGIVQHRENPFRSTSLTPQHAALQAAEDETVMRNCAWGICMDVDEFINIRLGDGRLPTLFAAMEQALPGANMIAMTWRLFGNADVHGFEDRPVISQFDRCAPEFIRKPHQAWGFKTLFRNIDIYRKLGVHRPKGLNPDLWQQIRWLNGAGKPMPREMFRNGWRSTPETYGYAWVQLNHYAVRSTESFLVKRDRGRVNHVERDQGLNYWFRMNHNADQDRMVTTRLPMFLAEWDRLMADPDIAAAHAACVAAHRQKIAALRATPAPAAFFEELTGDRMQRLCRLQRHFGSSVFQAGPQVIPDEVLAAPLAPDFFFAVEGEPDEETLI